MKIQGIIKELLIVLYSFFLEITCIFHIFNILMMVVEFFFFCIRFFFIVGCVFIAWEKGFFTNASETDITELS